ncbi:MAG: winged helix-turn-helix transcriptional regulator [Anaerolineales bacterium]|nr:winged helix-turn-helix transcriptional regulator [Anaerolineales bacterium]
MSNNTRERVLKNLLLNQRCTVNELAEAVDINPISVRHHVNKLEAEGLITSEEERHGVGRPRLVYSLTKRGMERFPKRYLTLTLRILDQLEDTLSKKAVSELFQDIAEDMAEEMTQDIEIEQLTMKERLNLLQEVMTSKGYTVTLSEQDDTYHVIEASCPYHHVGESHPEICAVDQELISRFVAVPPKRITCILDGDTQCTYVIPKTAEEM